MAQTKKGATKAKKVSKKDAQIVPDFYEEFDFGNGGNLKLSLYDRDDKADGVKLVINDAFIIHCRAIVGEDYAFLSYPSFKSGDKFINQAYCFDKDLIEKINDALTAYYFD